MIRLLIEVTEAAQWDFDKNLRETLDRLGFEPKRSAEQWAFMDDLHAALRERDLEAWALVEDYRGRKK